MLQGVPTFIPTGLWVSMVFTLPQTRPPGKEQLRVSLSPLFQGWCIFQKCKLPLISELDGVPFLGIPPSGAICLSGFSAVHTVRC